MERRRTSRVVLTDFDLIMRFERTERRTGVSQLLMCGESGVWYAGLALSLRQRLLDRSPSWVMKIE
jgi:hypothetical protein